MNLIDRQTAIDALWAERMKLSEEMERNLETCSFALRADNKARRNRVEEDIEIINQLPPAQPQRTDTLKAEIKRMKRSFTTCINSDYYTGYMSALSAVEGYISKWEGDAE